MGLERLGRALTSAFQPTGEKNVTSEKIPSKIIHQEKAVHEIQKGKIQAHLGNISESIKTGRTISSESLTESLPSYTTSQKDRLIADIEFITISDQGFRALEPVGRFKYIENIFDEIKNLHDENDPKNESNLKLQAQLTAKLMELDVQSILREIESSIKPEMRDQVIDLSLELHQFNEEIQRTVSEIKTPASPTGGKIPLSTEGKNIQSAITKFLSKLLKDPTKVVEDPKLITKGLVNNLESFKEKLDKLSPTERQYLSRVLVDRFDKLAINLTKKDNLSDTEKAFLNVLNDLRQATKSSTLHIAQGIEKAFASRDIQQVRTILTNNSAALGKKEVSFEELHKTFSTLFKEIGREIKQDSDRPLHPFFLGSAKLLDQILNLEKMPVEERAPFLKAVSELVFDFTHKTHTFDVNSTIKLTDFFIEDYEQLKSNLGGVNDLLSGHFYWIAPKEDLVKAKMFHSFISASFGDEEYKGEVIQRPVTALRNTPFKILQAGGFLEYGLSTDDFKNDPNIFQTKGFIVDCLRNDIDLIGIRNTKADKSLVREFNEIEQELKTGISGFEREDALQRRDKILSTLNMTIQEVSRLAADVENGPFDKTWSDIVGQHLTQELPGPFLRDAAISTTQVGGATVNEMAQRRANQLTQELNSPHPMVPTPFPFRGGLVTSEIFQRNGKTYVVQNMAYGFYENDGDEMPLKKCIHYQQVTVYDPMDQKSKTYFIESRPMDLPESLENLSATKIRGTLYSEIGAQFVEERQKPDSPLNQLINMT